MNTNELLAERCNTHGYWPANARVAAALRAVVIREGDNLPVEQAEAVHAICGKLARILAGDYAHVDHWYDVIGYATLALREIDREGS